MNVFREFEDKELWVSTRARMFACVLVSVASVRAEVVVVDVYEWARTGTGVTPNGWEVSGIDEYAGKGVRINTQSEYALSPRYPYCVTQLVMTVRSSATNTACFLSVVPEEARSGAPTLRAKVSAGYGEQTFTWSRDDEVRQFRLRNIGTGNAGWGIRSLSVGLDRLEAPQNLHEDEVYSDALSVAWASGGSSVSNELQICRVVTVPPSYDLMREWDFSSLTNTSGNTRYFGDPSDFPSALSGVAGDVLNLQGRAGGHVQIGNTERPGLLALALPPGTGRQAVIVMRRHEKDGSFLAHVDYEGPVGTTNEIRQVSLGVRRMTEVAEIPDGAVGLIVRNEKKDNRIRVEDVKVVRNYDPGSVATNAPVSFLTTRQVRLVKNLVPGDWIWRVKSFDGDGGDSAWSSYRVVTLSADDPKRTVRGLVLVVR